jgi:sugar phosphate isomerase/epimerase
MVRPAIQLYTLRNVDRPLSELLEAVADAGFEGVEFAYQVTETDPDAVVETLESTGLDVAGAHVSIEALEENHAETVEFYDRIGVENVVVPFLDVENFQSREAVADAADRLAAIGEALVTHDKRLHYHNHDHEYVDLGGETAFDAFVETTDCGIELDLGLAMCAGDDPVERLHALGSRSELVHLKDYDVDAEETRVVGEGNLDLDGIAAALEANGSDWLIYEYEGADPLETLERAADRTSELC